MKNNTSQDLKSRSIDGTAIDLFAGCGGLTLGLKNAGFRVLGSVEIDQRAASTYRSNHPEVCLHEGDVRSLDAQEFMEVVGLKAGELGLLAGCPPCQGFSRLRTKNRGVSTKDRRNNLTAELLRFVKVFMPRSVMMENVPALAEHRSFKTLCGGLRSLGYHLKFDLRNARDFGVPQRRRRLILLAGLGFDVPFADRSQKHLTVRDTIAKLPVPGKSRDPLHNLSEKRSPRILRMIRDIPKDGGSRGDLPDDRQLECHKRQNGFHDIYGRMAWDQVSPTITGGCFNPSKGRFLHPDQDRAITLREAALLQGFPRNYRFDITAGKEATALMIGNALPPEFIRRHAVQIRIALQEAGTAQ
jgi:DNA (cytosine-5)-methyltransferase 1